MAGRGGERAGAGRPKGAPSKRTQEAIDKAIGDGLTPLQVLMDGMRWYQELAEREHAKIKGKEFLEENEELFKVIKDLKNNARDYATAAAPYSHAKLSSIEAKVAVTNQEAALTELE